MQRLRSKHGRTRGLLPAFAFVALLLGGSIAEAVQTAYCEETYIGDCLNVQHCWFYSDTQYLGQAIVHYNCPL